MSSPKKAFNFHLQVKKKTKKIKVKKKKQILFGRYVKFNRILVFVLHLKFGETCADTSPDLTDTISIAIID